jgi:hypothetical protein
MKTASILILFLTLFSFAGFSQDDDCWMSKEYSVQNFSGIYLKGGFKVVLMQGKTAGITVKAKDEEVFEKLDVETWDKELRVEVNRNYMPYDRIRLYITVVNLEEMKVEGGLNLRSDGYLDLKDVLLHVEGGAKVDLKLKADDVQVIGEGGVMVDLEGVAKSLNVRVSGAGHVDAEDLKTETVDFRIEGVGTGSVYALETLNATIEGVGKIRYKGNPKIYKNIEGLGSVSCN